MILPCGWENTELLIALCKGTPEITGMINSSTYSSVTPLMVAKIRNQKKMVQIMTKLTKMGNIKLELPAVDDSTPETQYNINVDSETFLAKLSQKNQEENILNDKIQRKPHKNSGYEDLGEICTTKSANGKDIVCKILLTRTDLQYGSCGFHNYYRIELIKRKGVELYVLFTNWGRIGDPIGQYQRTPFSSFADANKEFCSIFKAKTGNEFTDIENFVEKPNRYKLLQVDHSVPQNIAELEIQLKPSRVLSMDDSKIVYWLINDISNVKRLQQRTRMVSNYNRLQVPFGRLSRNDILSAHAILVKLKNMTDELDRMRKNMKPVDEILVLLRKQAALSNEFYRLVPLGGFESLSLPIIDNDPVIKEYEKTIEDLLEFEIAGKLVTAAYEKKSTVDPFLYIKDALECEIELLDVEDTMTQFILQYIQNSSHSRIMGIFSLKSRHSNKQFNGNSLNVKDHVYLWHGTKPENLLSILKFGLVASPSSALQTGQIFGQVALGEVEEVQNVYQIHTEEKKSYDTLKINGDNAPDPLYNLTLEDGIRIPIGQVNRCAAKEGRLGYGTGVSYNEYIVSDKSHVTVRYLVAFR
uniref:Poly [ADP-ribose] polymerase n=1 Tax=Syphacia muris TaxID=451379 RepID=A0A0N5ACC3_9BILA